MQKQTRLTTARLRLWSLVLAVSALVSLISGWDIAIQKLNDVRRGVTDLSTAFRDWLTTPLTFPLWIFFLLMIFVFAGVLELSRKTLTKRRLPQVRKNEWKLFRNLWMEIEKDNGAITVVNRAVNEAVCGVGKCERPMVDIVREGGSAVYLVCQNGHKVGNEIEYEIYEKQKIDEKAEIYRKIEELEKARAEAMKIEPKDIPRSRVPAPNTDAGATGDTYRGIGSPSVMGGRSLRPDAELAYEFYAELLQEFEYDQNRRTPGKVANKESELIIHDAVFGAGDVWSDVTDTLKASIKNEKLVFYVHTKNLRDPLPYVPKTLRIAYSFQGIKYTKTYSEGETTDIP